MKKEEVEKQNNFWLDLLNLIQPSQKQLKKLLVLTILFEIASLLGPYLLKIIIDKINNFQQEEIGLIVGMVALMFLSEQLNSFFHYYKDKITFALLIDIENYLPIRAQKKLMDLELSYHEKENTGNKIIKIEKGVTKIIDLLANTSWEVGPTFIQMSITLLILFIIDYRFGLSFMIFAPAFIFITFKVNKDLRPIRKKRHKDYEEASGKMGQSIININTVKSFVQERREIAGFKSIKEMIKINELKEWWKLLRVGLFRNLMIDLGRIIIILLGVYMVWHKMVTIGTLVFVITLSEKAYFSLYRLSRFYDKIEEGKVAVNRFVSLANEEVKIRSKENSIIPDKIEGRISFENLSFRYEEAGENALDNINILINSGCVTALVGPSGGGKTTLARMIYRHYDPQSGKVKIDGVDVRDYDFYGFRKFISIVPQEVEVFNESVASNISYAKPDASHEEIVAAAKIANAHEFIEKLPGRYETEVGERGIKLSGGQRQRVGIARAILANPRILIFDEATSNLDSESERLIQDAMNKIKKGRTMIIIAHRLSTIKKADKIVVLENGKIMEEGSHLELARRKGGLYRKLLDLQKVGDVD